MYEEIQVLAHSCVRIEGARIVYFDPYLLAHAPHDADIVCLTHDHYDHFSPEDLKKVIKPSTQLIVPFSMMESEGMDEFAHLNTQYVLPNQTLMFEDLMLEAVPAYNIGKAFHPQKNGWVGYVLTMNDKRYYVAGDTDATPEAACVQCDVALVPVGGTYTFTADEAAAFINELAPQAAIPTHYGSVVGTPGDGAAFVAGVKPPVQAFEKLAF